jgi:hypothetical protein
MVFKWRNWFCLIQTHCRCFAERELSQLAARSHFARVGRFSARANPHAAVGDQPRSMNEAPALVTRPTLSKFMRVTNPPAPFYGRLGR